MSHMQFVHGRYVRVAANSEEGLVERNMRQIQNVRPY
jgi:hypothetical protein